MTRVELYAQALGGEAPDSQPMATMIAYMRKRITEPGAHAALIPNVIHVPPRALEAIELYAAPPVIEP